MNTNLLNIVKHITSQYGEEVLADPRRLKAFFGDLAKDEPKPLRLAFGRCVEERAYDALKTASDASERAGRKAAIAQHLRDEYGLDVALCGEALDILEAALFEGVKQPILCKGCGTELVEGWKLCPFCGMAAGAAEPPVYQTLQTPAAAPVASAQAPVVESPPPAVAQQQQPVSYQAPVMDVQQPVTGQHPNLPGEKKQSWGNIMLLAGFLGAITGLLITFSFEASYYDRDPAAGFIAGGIIGALLGAGIGKLSAEKKQNWANIMLLAGFFGAITGLLITLSFDAAYYDRDPLSGCIAGGIAGALLGAVIGINLDKKKHQTETANTEQQ